MVFFLNEKAFFIIRSSTCCFLWYSRGGLETILPIIVSIVNEVRAWFGLVFESLAC